MKKIYLGILITSLLWTGCRRNSYKEKFLRFAEEENARCPRRLNETTVMDSTHYDADRNVVHYYYTLYGEKDDKADMKANAALYKVQLQKAADNLLELQEYRKQGTGFHIVYHSASNGEVLAEFSF